jgi:excisionase family DNA binding protein
VPRKPEQSEWLKLSEASELLGIHPTTLRDWVDAGSIPFFRTPGRHRRFHVAELRAFLGQRHVEATRALAASPDQTLIQVRQQLHSEPVQRASWFIRLSEEQRAKQRALGQRLLGLLLQFVSRKENAEHFLAEGQSLARKYGRGLARARLSASEVARAFLFFRRTIIGAAFSPARSAIQGDPEGVLLLERINIFMDELLIATLDAYEHVRSVGSHKKAISSKERTPQVRVFKRLKAAK